MKRTVLLKIFLISSIMIMDVRGSEHVVEDDLTKVTRLLREVDERITENHQYGTIYLGNTEAGKSTLFNYMQGAPLQGKAEGFGKYRIKFVPGTNEEKYSPIGHKSSTSETTLPFVISNNFDSPGFHDTRHLQDIVNAYSIYRIINQTENLKILLVSSFSEIYGTARTDPFLNLINQVGEIFQNDIDHLCNSLCLVVTKVKNEETKKDDYKSLFTKIINEQINVGVPQDSARIKILKFLSQHTNDRISFFRTPKTIGPISNDDKIVIQKMVDTIPYQPRIIPTLSLSDRSKLAVNGLISYIFEEMRKTVFDLKNYYPELYQNYILSHLEPNTRARELRKKFSKISDQLKSISDESYKFYGNVKSISTILKLLSKQNHELLSPDIKNLISDENQKKFKDYGIKLDFFQKIGLEKKISLEIRNYDIFSSLEGFCRDAEDFVIHEPLNGKTGIKGFLLGISDLNEFIREQNKTLFNISLYSFNTLIIDENFYQPSLNLILIAPYWRVIGDKIISLKGSDGLPHENDKAKDGNAVSLHGEDGLPGNPGQSGGNFYGRDKVFSGLDHLTIDVSGGNGGPGQHGGNGAVGKNGIPGNKKDVEDRKCLIKENPKKTKKEGCSIKNTSYKTLRSIYPLITFGNNGIIEHYQSGTFGEPGGDAGKGGIGGMKGEQGDIDFPNFIIRVDTNEKSQEGKPGNPGQGGDGGIHEPIYIGTYANIKMFGFHKDILQEFLNNTIGSEDNRKYNWFGRLAKKAFGCGGCLDLTQYGIKGGVFTLQLGFEALKVYCLYQLGVVGPYLVAAEAVFSTAHIKQDPWWVKPQQIKMKDKTAARGKVPNSYNTVSLQPAIKTEPIDFMNEQKNYSELYSNIRINKLLIPFEL